MYVMPETDRRKATENGIVAGYAATWIREPDSYGDICRKGCFADSIAQIEREGRVLPFLFNHRHDDIMSYIGRIVHLEEDDIGLFFEAIFDESREAQRARELLKNKSIAGFSFAYDVLDQGTVTLSDGRKANELRKLALKEISCCLYPANPDTRIIDVKKRRKFKGVSDVVTIESMAKRARLLRKADKLLREAKNRK